MPDDIPDSAANGADPSHIPPAVDAPMLAYALPRTGGMKIVARFGTVEEAEISSGELSAHGIPSSVLNQYQSGLGLPYTGMIDVELHVPEEDAARAAEILRQAKSDEWEPADGSVAQPPPTDTDGHPIPVAVAARFDRVRKLREAQTLLASAGVTAYLPPLVPRAGRPAGVGDRFVLRVAEIDLPRAQSLLDEAQAEERDPDDLVCPKCGSRRAYPVSHFWQGLAASVGLAAKPADLVDCLACHYRGARAEFAPG